ncbi:MAG: hypothetical protein COB50_01055 [Thiotrichales bacterium]|nr:MAG: hypothetical protein COB50_01055 [Thiotrichales bacterium]
MYTRKTRLQKISQLSDSLSVSKSEDYKLSNLLRQADYLYTLTKQLDTYLPDFLQGKCNVVGFNNGILKILIDGTVDSTELFYGKRSLLKVLQKVPEFLGVLDIKIKRNNSF